MSAKVIHFKPHIFLVTENPALGSRATVWDPYGDNVRRDAVVCAKAACADEWMCAYSTDRQEQLALEARLERKRFKKASRQTPPAA